MNRIEFRRSPGKHLLIVAGSLFFVLCGYVIQRSYQTDDRVIGRIAMGFFGLCAIASSRQLMLGGTAVVFDDGGIIDQRLGIGVIPWPAIQRCRVFSYRGTRILTIMLHEPETFLVRMSPVKRFLTRANRQLGFGHLAVGFTGLTPAIDEALRYLAAHHPELLT
ncbi:MAG TPA: STM3941 family protein [Thermoanaerobaculia bacterium]|nr:STM3941 family protein [Thermoanaerobaculia bacterium]